MVQYSNVRIQCISITVIFCVASVTPYSRCRLKMLKMERIKDFLMMEEELIQNQGRLKPQEQRNEVLALLCHVRCVLCTCRYMYVGCLVTYSVHVAVNIAAVTRIFLF